MSTVAGGGRRADAVRNRKLALDAAIALLSEPGATLTVEAVARKAGLGAGTVVRAFGGKDALVDAAVSRLLQPVVARARDLLAQTGPEQALRVFLAELIAFQSSHHLISEQLGGLDLPATTTLRAELVRAVEDMIAAARRDGVVRADLEPEVIAVLIGESAFAIARSSTTSGELADAYITVMMDGLRPQ
ncbi:TetR/AcrR family transcriptional regulator [Plantactinospora sp. S1510]|uniref:TetR/AcrR family transcriptional regulator n=1 Tax=Plantactinospora alkalitolerans TaxID=2789879 RepID=A0ABS0H062_9ACTN|nr:TetR/AcrR family transcriptional regulator [Plantactinospora alkalitolerans]MBF9131853.1 TetR/AcrR family transcriptional regulator [Plantactinospora alkalitolerans]